MFEVIVALAILAILVGIAIPTYTTLMPRYRLSGATRQLAGDLMAARMKAVKLSSKVGVFIADQEYKICDDANHDNTVGASEGDVQVFNLQIHYPGVSFLSPASVIFHPRGTVESGVTVTLKNSRDETKDVTVNIAGRVKQL